MRDPRLRSPEAVLRSTGTPPDLWKYGISGDLPIVLVTVADAGAPQPRPGARPRAGVLCVRAASSSTWSCSTKSRRAIARTCRTTSSGWRRRARRMHGSIGPAVCSCGAPISLPKRIACCCAPSRARFSKVRAAVSTCRCGGRSLPSPPPPKIKMKPAVPAQSEPLRPCSNRWCSSTASAGSRRTAGNFTYRRVHRRPGRTSSRTSASGSSRPIRASAPRGPRTAIHNRLTPWSNDPIVDPPSEVVYLRDDKSGEFWTATPAPAAGAVRHVAKFGQGYATYTSSTPRARRRAHRVCARERSRQDSAAPNPQRHHRASRVERLLLRGLVPVGHPLALGGAHRHVD